MSKPNTRAIIDANIRQNGQQLITGQVLNATLNAMVTDYAEQAALDGLKEKVDALALGAFYGYFPDSDSLPTDVTTPGYAYVGSDNPYEIWNFNGESWSDSGSIISSADTINVPVIGAKEYIENILSKKDIKSTSPTILIFGANNVYDWDGVLNINKKYVTLCGGGTIKGSIHIGFSKEVYDEEGFASFTKAQANIHVSNLRFIKEVFETSAQTIDYLNNAVVTNDDNISISLTNVSNVRISNCSFNNVPFPVVFKPNDTFVNQCVRRVYITNCDFDRCNTAFTSIRSSASNVIDYGDTTFNNNNIYPTQYGVNISNIDGFVCQGNTIFSCAKNDIYANNAKQILIQGNELFGTYCENVIRLVRPSQISISNNNFSTFKSGVQGMDGTTNVGVIYFESGYSYNIVIDGNIFDNVFGIPVLFGDSFDVRTLVVEGNGFYNETFLLKKVLLPMVCTPISTNLLTDYHLSFNYGESLPGVCSYPIFTSNNEYNDILNYYTYGKGRVYHSSYGDYTIDSVTKEYATIVLSPARNYVSGSDYSYEFLCNGKYYTIGVESGDTGSAVISKIYDALSSLNGTGFSVSIKSDCLYIQLLTKGKLLYTPFVPLVSNIPVNIYHYSVGVRPVYKDKDGHNFLRNADKNNMLSAYYLSSSDFGRIQMSDNDGKIYVLRSFQPSWTNYRIQLTIPSTGTGTFFTAIVAEQFLIVCNVIGKSKSVIISEIEDIINTYYSEKVTIDTSTSNPTLVFPSVFLEQPFSITSQINVSSPTYAPTIYSHIEYLSKINHATKTSGTTAERPTIGVDVGFKFFDTSLNKPIYWTGSKWVDATGADA